MADKLTQLVVEALSRAAADPTGVPLWASRSEAGLFPPTSAAKPAAKRCLDDGFLQTLPADPRNRISKELVRITAKGTEFLLDQANPKQVLEDIARVLEARQAEVAELQSAVRRMADGLEALATILSAVTPRTAMARAAAEPTDLPATILAHLAKWTAATQQDCPLPDVFAAATAAHPGLTVGRFHDALRLLHAAGRVYLHPWTGPLYAVPDPSVALLSGHNVAYYASVKS